MTITKTQENEKVILLINGRLDTATTPKLHDELLPIFDSAKEIMLDFAELVYVSSAGLRVLLVAQKTAKSKGATLQIYNISSEVMEVLDMTGFSSILNIV